MFASADGVHDAQHVLGAMVDFAHEEALLFLALLAFRLAVTAIATSQASNPGPVDFVALEDLAGRQEIAELRLIK